MDTFHLDFTDKAMKDIDFHKKSANKILLKKLYKFLNEISDNPFVGIGKPEALKYSLSGAWSGRLNKEHRLIYEVVNNVVYILSVRGHY